MRGVLILLVAVMVLIVIAITAEAKKKKQLQEEKQKEEEAKEEQRKKRQQEFEQREKARLAEIASRPSYDNIVAAGHGDVFRLRNLNKKDESTVMTRLDNLESCVVGDNVDLETMEGGRILVVNPRHRYEYGELGQNDSLTILAKAEDAAHVYAYFLGVEFDSNDKPVARIEVFYR